MIHDTEDKPWWVVHGGKLEEEFVKHVVPKIRLKAFINPEKETDPYAPDLSLKGRFLFSWDEISGNDNGRLIEFLTQKFGIDWVKTSKIEKTDDYNTIKVSTEKKYLSLKLNDEKTKVDLIIDGLRADKYLAKMENGKLNIYEWKLVELKTQNTPFFTIGKHCKKINGKEIPYNPRYTVSFNKDAYLRYKKKYSDLAIFFWVTYKEEEKFGIKVLPLAGVWYIEFNELIIRIESGEYKLRPYDNRIHDTDGNAKESYYIDLRDLELIELFEGEIKPDDL